MKRFKLLLSILFAGVLYQSNAQDIVSLKDAVNYALQNKADAKRADLAVKKAEFQINEARAGALPQISVNSGVTYNPILQKMALPGEFVGQPGQTLFAPLGTKFNSNLGVNINQNIFDQRVFTGLKAAKTTREFYQVNAELTDEQIIERVANAYYQVFVQEEKLQTINISLENTTKVKNVIKSLVDNGLAKQIDLDRIIVQLNNISSNRQQLINAVNINKNSLKFYMGYPIEQDIDLAQESIQPNDLLLEETINVENRTEYKVLSKQKELLGFARDAEKASLYPTVSLAGNYGLQGLGDKFITSKDFYWSELASIGLNVKIPIFTGGATKSKIGQAEIDLLDIEEQISDTKLGLDLEYQNAKAQIENALKTVDIQKENVSLAEKVLTNTQNNYQQGLANLTEILDSENALTDARNNYSNALLEYKIAEVALIKAKGDLKTLIQ
ncbi:Outer membrane protein TolC [Chishuiella changwenlii]|jgi:outer membrane protein TolC|uniref:Outer membrane protein TolC n=1 Tax=Chishuiella changwenlii TaxID=1434701 RepID=A0A1M6XKI6_9FLAO|nr:TolC family protein [Chishuiella changwenlii]GGF01173.1 RND transporter [Chishuiella changwenlii]SHL06418.1 Outer membrane protein TolC [Chishuiella changwenlii]